MAFQTRSDRGVTMTSVLDVDQWRGWRKRIRTWWTGVPDLEAMPEDEFQEWHEKFLFRIDCQLAWSNYVRSDEAKSILDGYNRFTDGAFYIALLGSGFLAYIIGLDLGSLYASFFVIGATLAMSFGAVSYARRRYALKPLQYAVDNYWPTNDGNPKTDHSAIPERPEGIGDRLAHFLFVAFWLAFILGNLFLFISTGF